MANRADLTRGEPVDEDDDGAEDDEDATEAILVIMFSAPGAASAYMLDSSLILNNMFGSAQNSDNIHSKLLSCNNLRHHFLRLLLLAGFMVIIWNFLF